MTPSTTTARQSLIPFEDRVDIIDALRRFAAGQDDDDIDLLASAFSKSAWLDFTHPAARLGVDLARFEGRDAIVSAVAGATAALDTTHTLTNERITGYSGETAELRALIEAQHLDRLDDRRRLLLKNALTVELARTEDGWRITGMAFRNVWREGDPKVLFPG